MQGGSEISSPGSSLQMDLVMVGQSGCAGERPQMVGNPSLDAAKGGDGNSAGKSLPAANQILGEKGKAPVVPSSGAPSWASVVSGPSRSRHSMPMHYFEPQQEDGKLMVTPPFSILEQGALRWNCCLVNLYWITSFLLP